MVVTDSQGTALASSGGYKDATQWKALLRAARAKAEKTSADSTSGLGGAGKSDPSWPFKTAPVKQ